MQRLRRGERRPGSYPAQFEHPVADVTVLGQMGGSHGFTAAGDHLVGRMALSELGVELPAKLTRPAGACIKAINYGWIDVFHEKHLLGRCSGTLFWDVVLNVRRSHIVPPRIISLF